MATVITNLLSAIPFIGNDIVPFIIILPLYFQYYIFNKQEFKKEELKKENKFIINQEFKDKLAFLVGFIDGDGYLRVSKKGKYIVMSLVLNLAQREYDFLCKIRDTLNMGTVYYITSKYKKYVRYELSKRDLINTLIPMLDINNLYFLTENRQRQYLMIKYIINNNIVLYDDINQEELSEYIESNLLKNNFNELDYFSNWLVGFTVAEGSFCKKKNNDICYKLKQKYNFTLFRDILAFLKTSQNLSINQGKYVEYSVSSKKDIQRIIYFFSYNDFLIKPDLDIKYPTISLQGLKLISYNKWLVEIKNSKRYNNLILPF